VLQDVQAQAGESYSEKGDDGSGESECELRVHFVVSLGDRTIALQFSPETVMESSEPSSELPVYLV
jgi:hypothetical protein